MDGGLASVCFTEHFSVLDHDPSYRYLDQAAYLADWESCTRQYAGRLDISLGLEIGEPHRHPREIAAACSGLPLDFVIGSIHNIGREKLRMYQSRHGAQAAYAAYFTAVLAMAEAGDIDVIGHLDLMKRYAGENYRYQDYAPLIDRILQTAVRRGIGLEINASNLDATGGAAPGNFSRETGPGTLPGTGRGNHHLWVRCPSARGGGPPCRGGGGTPAPPRFPPLVPLSRPPAGVFLIIP